MPEPATYESTAMPLGRRLRRATLVAVLLGIWAPFKIVWEQNIATQQDFLRYRGISMTHQLRDQLGQGLSIGVLSGMGSVVADLVWLESVSAWKDQDWPKMSRVATLTTVLQPRAPIFWDMGGWHLAWNASIAALQDPTQKNDLKRLKTSRFWLDKGLDLYKRGIENNPTNWKLWQGTGMLYDQRLKDYRSAAYYYQRASELPGAPIYLERNLAEMHDSHHLNDPQGEYEQWVKLWNRLTPEEKADKAHAAARLEGEIRRLENQLSVPKEKRIFPN